MKKRVKKPDVHDELIFSNKISKIMSKLSDKDADVLRTVLKENNIREKRLKVLVDQSYVWLENSPVCTKIVDLDFNLKYMSKVGRVGLSIKDINKYYGTQYPLDFYPDSFKKQMNHDLKKVLDNGIIATNMGVIISLSGQEKWYYSTILPVNDEQGLIEYLMVVSIDITGRKSANDNLIVSRNKFRRYLENSPYGIFITDSNGSFSEVNRQVNIITGYSHNELLKLKFQDIVADIDKDRHREVIGALIKNDHINIVIQFLTKDKKLRYMDLQTVKIEDDRCLHFIQDITEKILIEKKLIQAEKTQRILLDNLQAGIVIHSADTSIIFCNPIAEKLLGLSFEKMQGKVAIDKYWRFVTEEGTIIPVDKYPVSKIISSKKAMDTYVLGVLKSLDSDPIWLIVNGYPVFDDKKQIKEIVISFIDISDSKRKEKAIQDSELKHKAMISNISDVISIMDKEGVILYCSPNVKKWFGWNPSELIGLNALVTIHPDDLEYVKGEFDRFPDMLGTSADIEYRLRCKDDSYKHIHLSATNLFDDSNIGGILVNYHDISDSKRLEEEKKILDTRISQQQRLNSIGTLAGGVAHEINNPLNGIMNYGQLILDKSEVDSENEKFAKEIISETERIAIIVKNLLRFSRNEKQEHSYANISDIIEHTLSLIRAVIRHDQIELIIDINDDLPSIKCRSQQIQQVVLNLLTNSRDTLNEKYHGYHEDKTIKLTCEKIHELNQDFIKVTIEDRGMGIPKTIQEKIYEPFFSTKSKEKGTGLGLSISYGIIKDHKGELGFETVEGEYTKFYFTLPVNNGWHVD